MPIEDLHRADVADDPVAVQALAAAGFNPQSQPPWSYHWGIYWGLTQKIYRLEFDPQYTGYTCPTSSRVGIMIPFTTIKPASTHTGTLSCARCSPASARPSTRWRSGWRAESSRPSHTVPRPQGARLPIWRTPAVCGEAP
jgi:hypothetical protein